MDHQKVSRTSKTKTSFGRHALRLPWADPARAKLAARLRVFAVFIVLVAVSWNMAANMKEGRLSPDGLENLALSLHLRSAGQFSEDGHQPSYLREPFPIITSAVYMSWLTGIPESATVDQVKRNPGYLDQLVRINLYYYVGLLLAVWWLAWLLTKSAMVSVMAIAGTALFSKAQHHSGNLLTESAAALIIVLACGVLVWLVQSRRWPAAVLAGVLLGAVALSKAVGLYVVLVLIPTLAAALVLCRLAPPRRALWLLGLTALTFAFTVTPWMARNYVQFGDFAIAQRGGIVLYTRAVKDGMSMEEYRGAFYAYAPGAVREHLFVDVLGFQPEDLEPEGRYARLIRYPPGEAEIVAAGDVEHTISYFGRAWATKVRLSKQMAAVGKPESEVDRVLQERAVHMIKAAPGKHLAMTLPFAWRGLWCFSGQSLASDIANLVAFVLLLALPFVALRLRRADWLALSLLPAGLFWFHALFTHFITRYSEPLIPLAVLSSLVLAHAFFVHRRHRGAS